MMVLLKRILHQMGGSGNCVFTWKSIAKTCYSIILFECTITAFCLHYCLIWLVKILHLLDFLIVPSSLRGQDPVERRHVPDLSSQLERRHLLEEAYGPPEKIR